MKSILILLLPLWLLSSCQPDSQHPLAFDMSGIDPFFEIMDSLKMDREPSDSLWESMFLTPGYKTLTEVEFPVDWIKSYMRGGIMPAQQAVYREWVEKKFWDTVFCVHMRNVYGHKEELLEFETVINNAHFVEDAVQLTAKYWDGSKLPADIPPISFLFFSKDARGYDPVIIDLLYALDKYQKGGLLELVAHEFHHYYRNKVLSFKYPDEKNPDFKVVHTINQIHLEGIADMIDKRTSLANPYYASSNAGYHQNLVKTPGDMAKLDSLLTVYGESADSSRISLAQIISETVRNSGHPMGYFMATSIWQLQSKESVYQEIGNPFSFFRRYNECAKNSSFYLPLFSEEAMAVLKKIELTYSQKEIRN